MLVRLVRGQLAVLSSSVVLHVCLGAFVLTVSGGRVVRLTHLVMCEADTCCDGCDGSATQDAVFCAPA